MNRTLNLRKRRGEKLDEWQAVLKRIKEDGQRRSAEEPRREIVAYFERVKDEGITAERISLLCPISNKRVIEPARGVDCTHFACFDMATYLELQSKTPNWDCPFSTCKKKLSSSTIVTDEYIGRVLVEVDDSVVKIELLPSGAWKPVEAEREATDSLGIPPNDDDVQVVLDKSAASNQEEVAGKTVSVSVLEELRRQIGDLLEQFNGLGYKRLGGIAASLADMNIFVKQHIREAREPPTSTRTAASVLYTSTKSAATQTPTASATHDASSQTSPLEPSRDIGADSPSLASKVAPVPPQHGLAQIFDEPGANADSQSINHATPQDFIVHIPQRRPPGRYTPPEPKRPRAEMLSALSQPISLEKVRTIVAQWRLDVRSSFTECMTDRHLSLTGKRILQKESLRLHAENRLNSDALRMLLRLQLAQNRKEGSGTNVPDTTSVPPSPASSQPHPSADPANVKIHEADTKGGTLPALVKRRSRFELVAAGTPTSCPPVGVLNVVPIIGPQASFACHAVVHVGIVSSSEEATKVPDPMTASPSPASSQPVLSAYPVTVDAGGTATKEEKYGPSIAPVDANVSSSIPKPGRLIPGNSPAIMQSRFGEDSALIRAKELARALFLEYEPNQPIVSSSHSAEARFISRSGSASKKPYTTSTDAVGSIKPVQEPLLKASAPAARDSRVSSSHAKAVLVPADVPLPPNWAVARIPGGEAYYFHKITMEARWERPTESVADTTSSVPDSAMVWTAQEREFQKNICSIIKKRFEPYRERFKPDPYDYKRFIRKLLSKVMEKELGRGTDLKVTDNVALSTKRYVDSWVKTMQGADEKKTFSRSEEATTSSRTKPESPAGSEGPTKPVAQTATSVSKPAPH